MRILLVTNRVPFPPTSGYPIVVYNTIKGLVAQGADVSIFSLNPSNKYVHTSAINDPLFNKVKFSSATINTKTNNWDTFKNLFSSKAANISRFYQSDSVAKFKNFLRHHQFDIIQLEGLFVMPYIQTIRNSSKAKIIYRAHSLEHQLGEFLASSERSPIKRIYLKLLSKRLYRFEIDNLNKPDAVVTISESDQSLMRHLGCTVVMATFPVALDVEQYVPDTSKILFPSIFHLGSMDFLPNQESLEWFMRTVWADIKLLNTGLKLFIAGRDMPQHIFSYRETNVIVQAEVDNAKRYMNSKAIMIVPLKSGSGMRVRIIEGMAMKKCIISTSIGAEGIHYQHGKNILIADSPDEFYRSILQCITDKAFTESIGENARKLVEKEYNLVSQSEKLMRFYDGLLVNV